MEFKEFELNEEEKFMLRSKNLSTQELLANVDRFRRISFNWKNPDFSYLLEEPMRGWESAKEKGLPVPEKPSDANLLLFVDYYSEKLKEQDASEDLAKSLAYIKKTLEIQTVPDFDTDQVKMLYELDDFERFIKAQSNYIYEKNRAMGFVYDVILFSINRVREIINQKSLE